MWKLIDCGTYPWFVMEKQKYFHCVYATTGEYKKLRVKRKEIPIYADLKTSKYLKKTFSYCFKDNPTIPKSLDYPATLKLIRLKKKHIFSNLSIECIPVNHGNIDSVSFIINKKLAYASDAKLIYEKNINMFKNLKYFIVDCLR